MFVGNRISEKTGAICTSLQLAIFTLVALVLVMPFTRLDGDLHHDGYMVAAAIAVSEGKTLFRDVFMQYGPLITWIQAFTLRLGLPPVLTLRVVNGLFIVATALLIVVITKSRSIVEQRRQRASFWAPLLMLVIADYLYGVPMLPWVSTLFVLLLMVHYLLFLRVFHVDIPKSRRKRYGLLILCGSVLGLLFLVRPSFFGIALLGLIPLLLQQLWRPTDQRSLVLGLLIGSVSVPALSVATLAATGSLSPWWSQNFSWPARYTDLTQSWLDLAQYQIGTYLLPILFGILFSSIAYRRSQENSQRGIHVPLRNILALVAFVAAISVYILPSDPKVFVGSPRNSLSVFETLVVLYWTLVAIAVTQVILLFCKNLRTAMSKADLLNYWGAVVALSSLAQSFPVPDSRHLWWSICGAIFLIPSLLKFFDSRTKSFLALSIAPFVAASISLSLPGVIHNLNAPRVPQPSESAFEMMLQQPQGTVWFQEGLFNDYSPVYAMLSNHLRIGEKALFLTNDAIHSVFDQRYRSLDEWFVYWGPVPEIEERLDKTHNVVADSKFLFENPAIGESLQKRGFLQADMVEGLVLYSK